MKVLIVYSSAYGNTEAVARAMGAALAPGAVAEVRRAREAEAVGRSDLDLLLVGAPTQQRGVPTRIGVRDYVEHLADARVRGLPGRRVRYTARRPGIPGRQCGTLDRAGAGRSRLSDRRSVRVVSGGGIPRATRSRRTSARGCLGRECPGHHARPGSRHPARARVTEHASRTPSRLIDCHRLAPTRSSPCRSRHDVAPPSDDGELRSP